jgi:PAS domain S-box-containing protein
MEANLMKILAFEDNRNDLIRISTLLKNVFPGATIDTFSDGSAGIVLAESGDPDVILLEILPSAMDRLDLCRKLKERENLRDIPVICVMGDKSDRESRAKALESGADGFLSKPIDESELTAQVRAMVKIKKANISALRLLEDLKRENASMKEREKALLDSERNYRTIVDSGQALIWTSGTDMLCSYFNRIWLEFTGRTLEEETGKGWTRGVHPEDLERCVRIYTEAFAARREFSMDYRLRRFDGEYRWIQDNGCPRYDSAGIFIGYIGHCLDIDDRIKTEQKMREAARFQKVLIDAVPSPLFYKGKDGRYLGGNRAFESYLGLTGEEYIGKTVFDIAPADLADKYEAADRELFARSGTQVYDAVARYADGSRHDVIFNKAAFTDDEGNVAGLIGVIQDITERKAAEDAIHESEEKFSKIVNNSGYPIMIIDLSTGCYTEVNDAMVYGMGFTREELIGKNPIELGILQREALERSKKILQEKGSYSNIEVTIRKKDGSSLFGLASGQILFIKKRPFLIQTIFDLTERKEIQDRVNSLLAEKVLILKEIHHRVKNNMNTIYGYLVLQAGTLKERDSVVALEDAANRVRSMMLLYTKLYQANDYSAMSIALYLPVLIDEIVGYFPNSGFVRVEKNIADVVLRENQLQPLGIILNELLTNIMKYAFTGRTSGDIAVTVSTVGNKVTMIIADNGNGMPESIDFGNSTGFGLVLVDGLTKQLDGTIRIDRGGGTRIILEFEK